MKGAADFFDYCKAYTDYFFSWENDDGTLLAVSNGRAVCYLDQLAELLKLSGNNGVPRFGTLLLVMIATSADNKVQLKQVRKIFETAFVKLDPSIHPDKACRSAFEFLEKLSAIPDAYMQDAARRQLILFIFHNGHNLISGRRIQKFIEQCQQPAFNSELLTGHDVLPLGVLSGDLRPLSILNSKYPDTESILKLIANIPVIKELPLKLEEPDAADDKPKNFIDELVHERKTFHIGALIRRIWSGLAIPFHTHLPSVHPLGGVSDLSNKGDLDKLLISEYANDDLLFLSRLANGEALYINRETPPQTNRQQRIILIDTSLQTWGTPHTLAFALLIAIARHPKTDMVCSAFALGNSNEPIQYSTTDEVVAGLQKLTPAINAASGLEAYLEALTRRKEGAEVIFITSPDGYSQAPVQRVLSEHITTLTYCMTADEGGMIEVFKRRGRSLGRVLNFKLPLSELWAVPPDTRIAAIPEWHMLMPSAYPILLPAPVRAKAYLTTDDGKVFAITAERSVICNSRNTDNPKRKGWAYVRGGLPLGTCQYAIGTMPDGDYLLLCYAMDKKEVHLYNLSSSEHVITDINSYVGWTRSSRFYFWENGFILTNYQSGWKLSLEKDDGRDAYLKMRKLSVLPEALTRKYAEDISSQAVSKHHTHGLITMVSGGVLKHLKSAGITASGLIAVNQHQLIYQALDDTLRFTTPRDSMIMTAQHKARNMLQFTDGSTIAIDGTGMLTLKSADKKIPVIYIPSALDIAIGAAIEDTYAGVEFFFAAVSGQKRIKTEAFYQKFISAFIQQIRQHAAKA